MIQQYIHLCACFCVCMRAKDNTSTGKWISVSGQSFLCSGHTIYMHTHTPMHIRTASLPRRLKESRSQQNSPDTSSTGSNTSSSSIGSIQLSRQASDPGVDPSRSTYLHHQSSPSQRYRTSSGSQDSASQQSAALMSQTQTEVGNGGVWVAWVFHGREPATVMWVGGLWSCGCGWVESMLVAQSHCEGTLDIYLIHRERTSEVKLQLSVALYGAYRGFRQLVFSVSQQATNYRNALRLSSSCSPVSVAVERQVHVNSMGSDAWHSSK